MNKQKKFDSSYTQNREISWLRFNERVLEEASDEKTPLYERLKFTAIFTSNLDEFYMVRVGSLYDLSLVKGDKFDNKSFMTPQQQLDAIFAETATLYKKKADVFAAIEKALKAHDIFRVQCAKLTSAEKSTLDAYFTKQIAPILSPQIIDLQHPFPHLQNKALYVALILKKKKKVTLGILPVPATLPGLIFLPGETLRYVLLENIILAFAHKVFDMYTIVDKAVICVTRNADISPDDEAPEVGEDYLQHMRKALKKRQRLAPVRLEIETDGDTLLVEHLQMRLSIRPVQVFVSNCPINLNYVYALTNRFTQEQKDHLCYKPFSPVHTIDVPPQMRMMDYVREKDILLNFPYQSFDLFLQLMKEAAYDGSVVSIKITIYRVGKKTKLMNYLIAAAEAGKDVTVLMELKARFDEANNINWAENLLEAGCKIVYGLENYKVHSKICLITKTDGENIQYITQVGTGNYNAQTAEIYTDLSLITGNPEIGEDAAMFFKNLCLANLDGQYKHLLVAPNGLKNVLLDLIDQEKEKALQGRSCGILLKMNSLTDRELIDSLAAASAAGVEVQLIIRGICCLLPQVPGKTDQISVYSIVGRFLEHSRVYCFGVGEEMRMYISSADLMTRNTEKRVEVACPICDESIRRKIYMSLQIMLRDRVKGRELGKDGIYRRRKGGGKAMDSQTYFMYHYEALETVEEVTADSILATLPEKNIQNEVANDTPDGTELTTEEK